MFVWRISRLDCLFSLCLWSIYIVSLVLILLLFVTILSNSTNKSESGTEANKNENCNNERCIILEPPPWCNRWSSMQKAPFRCWHDRHRFALFGFFHLFTITPISVFNVHRLRTSVGLGATIAWPRSAPRLSMSLKEIQQFFFCCSPISRFNRLRNILYLSCWSSDMQCWILTRRRFSIRLDWKSRKSWEIPSIPVKIVRYSLMCLIFKKKNNFNIQKPWQTTLNFSPKIGKILRQLTASATARGRCIS